MICIEYFSFIRNLIINILEQVCVYFNSLGNLSSFVLIFELDHDFIYLFDWWYKLKKFLQIWNIKFSFFTNRINFWMNLHQKEKYRWKDLSMLKFSNLVNRHILMFENDLSPFFQRRLSTWQLWVVAREKKKELIYWASCYHFAWTPGFMEERETEDMTEKRTMGHKQSVKKKKFIRN